MLGGREVTGVGIGERADRRRKTSEEEREGREWKG